MILQWGTAVSCVCLFQLLETPGTSATPEACYYHVRELTVPKLTVHNSTQEMAIETRLIHQSQSCHDYCFTQCWDNRRETHFHHFSKICFCPPLAAAPSSLSASLVLSGGIHQIDTSQIGCLSNPFCQKWLWLDENPPLFKEQEQLHKKERISP